MTLLRRRAGRDLVLDADDAAGVLVRHALQSRASLVKIRRVLRSRPSSSRTARRRPTPSSISAIVGSLLIAAPAGLEGSRRDPCPPPVATPSPWPTDWEERAAALVEEINRVRSEGTACRGVALPRVARLYVDGELREGARRQTHYMALHDVWDHRVAGCDPSSWVDADRYRWTSFGQTLSRRRGRSGAAIVVASWIASRQGHCETVMSRKWRSVGVAYVRDGSRHLWTANFGNQ